MVHVFNRSTSPWKHLDTRCLCGPTLDSSSYAPLPTSFERSYADGSHQPVILIAALGAAVMCAALNIPAWNDTYTSEELGGLVGAALESHTSAGFAKFLMIVLVLSTVACNIVNVYS